MSSQFSASEQLIGYVYQIRYALLVFLRKIREEADVTNIEISIERLDDVAFEKNGEAIELHQTKHHVDKETTLTNATPDLWKTLRVWSQYIKENSGKTDNLLFFLITTAHAPDDSLIGKLRRDDKKRDEDSALEELIKTAQKSTNKSIKSAVDEFLSLSDAQKKLLIKSIVIVDGSPSIQDVDQKLFREMRTVSRYADSFKTRLEGWWIEKVTDHLVGNKGTINGSELQNKIYTLGEELSRENLPNDFPLGIFPMEEEQLNENQRIFVEQLRMILIGNERLRFAIGDYYRAFQQRTKWLSEGLVYPRELDDYEDYLVGEWQREFAIIKEKIEECPTEERESRMTQLGRELYNWSSQKKFEPIRPAYFDAYFSRGSYHILANALKIG
ncbi:MAG: ABC-three component system protein [Snowella sp.]|nr:ABC-three component system protein [Snowella sp.]